MKNFISKIYSDKKTIFIIVLIIIGLFLLSYSALAQTAADKVIQGAGDTVKVANSAVASAIAVVIGFIAQIITSVIGLLITVLIKILINVAQFNNIINVPVVANGWVIVRDLCNMFFILILLVIAFTTILRVESYSAKKLLPKLLIMAVLINFSKTICGLLIDASQVIMLTFANALNSGAGFFVNLFNTQYLGKISIDSDTNKMLNNWSVAVGSIAGVIAALITLIVLVVLLAVLAMRIVLLWVYVILSPVAFIAAAFPAGQKYSSQWWSEFTKQLIVGPVLVFFIWLALTTMQSSADKLMPGDAKSSICAGFNAFFCELDFQRFILGIAFLIGGLMITQQIGGMAGSIAGKGLGWAKKTPLVATGLGAWGARKFAKSKYGFQVNPVEIVKGIREGLKLKKDKDILEGQARSKELLEKGGLRGLVGGLGAGKDWTQNYVNGFLGLRGIRQAYRTVTHGPRWKEKKSKEIDLLVEQRKALGDVYSSQEEKDKDINRKQRGLEVLEKQKTELESRYNDALSKGDRKEADEVKQQITRNEFDQEVYKNDIVKMEEKEVNIEKLELTNKIDGLNKDMTKYMAPRGFEGRAASKALINEEKKKIADVKNADELITYLRDAIERKDKYRAAAVMEKLTQDANQNEFLNDFGYDSGSVGLHNFIQGQMIKKMGMREQEALALQNDISYIAEGNNHWEVARTVGTRADGKLVSLVEEKKDADGNVFYDDSKHAMAAYAEIMKLDPQVIARALNRLAYGFERMRADKSGRDFHMSTLGLMLTKALGDSAGFVDKHESRFNINTSQNLASEEAQIAMDAMGTKSEFMSMTRRKGTSSEGERLDPATVAYQIEQKMRETGFRPLQNIKT